MSYTSTYVGEFPFIFQAIEAGLGIEMYRPNAWFANVVKWWTYAHARRRDASCASAIISAPCRCWRTPQYYRPLAAIASRYRRRAGAVVGQPIPASPAPKPEQILFEDRPGVAADVAG